VNDIRDEKNNRYFDNGDENGHRDSDPDNDDKLDGSNGRRDIDGNNNGFRDAAEGSGYLKVDIPDYFVMKDLRGAHNGRVFCGVEIRCDGGCGCDNGNDGANYSSLRGPCDCRGDNRMYGYGENCDSCNNDGDIDDRGDGDCNDGCGFGDDPIMYVVMVVRVIMMVVVVVMTDVMMAVLFYDDDSYDVCEVADKVRRYGCYAGRGDSNFNDDGFGDLMILIINLIVTLLMCLVVLMTVAVFLMIFMLKLVIMLVVKGGDFRSDANDYGRDYFIGENGYGYDRDDESPC
jgi:hypothetical protein